MLRLLQQGQGPLFGYGLPAKKGFYIFKELKTTKTKTK